MRWRECFLGGYSKGSFSFGEEMEDSPHALFFFLVFDSLGESWKVPHYILIQAHLFF